MKNLIEETLKLIQFRLHKKLPYLSTALSLPSLCFTAQASGMDGERFFWNPREVLQMFQESPLKLERFYLHLMFHGLYLHALRRFPGSEMIQWLACDILTEYRIDRMNVPGFARPVPAERSRVYRKLREERVLFSEKKLAIWLIKQEKKVLMELEDIFRKDNHEYWRKTQQLIFRQGAFREQRTSPEELKRMSHAVHRFREVLEHLNLDQEEHKKQAGGSAGSQAEKVILEKERGYDYRSFLKNFAVTREELHLDMDSFDYIPYDYSRKLYKNLVILEPLEYKEMHKLQEFVIAIDTSGSCSGETVRLFLEETWEIFCEKENFFENMNVHLIQCDCLIQDHVRISSEKEWKDYLNHMEVKGHGDTDFTPVFRFVNQMVQDGELKNLKGLLYFTDGDGIYPEEKPEYETAFVYLNKELQKGKAPSWALTLTLDREL